jgi:hypothetical protein
MTNETQTLSIDEHRKEKERRRRKLPLLDYYSKQEASLKQPAKFSKIRAVQAT